MSRLLHWFLTVIHTLTFQGPSSEPVLEVFESLEAFSSSDDLTGVVSTEESIRSLSHFFRGDTETDHGSVDDAVVFKRPQVVELLLFHILMRG